MTLYHIGSLIQVYKMRGTENERERMRKRVEMKTLKLEHLQVVPVCHALLHNLPQVRVLHSSSYSLFVIDLFVDYKGEISHCQPF